MTASGQLVHISSSSSSSGNHVLDLAHLVPRDYRHSNKPLPLFISRANQRRQATQTWEFKVKTERERERIGNIIFFYFRMIDWFSPFILTSVCSVVMVTRVR